METVYRRGVRHEIDEASFPADAYLAAGWGAGIAWHVMGWEVEPDEDTVWSGCYNRTGRVVAVMVGDDARFMFDPSDLSPLDRENYCGVCGQVGCSHDGYPRDED